jgi:signal recognition particle receptor subunit beta
MVLFNHATREMTAKIVYYGPGLCGKTTNLMVVFDKLDPKQKGKMLSLATKTDRTLFFDLLPVDIGKVGAFNLKIQLYTVPGQVFYNETRKLVLKGADSVVFVADSQPSMIESNRESFANLMENLEQNNLDPNDTPIVIQFNKRDIPGVLPVEQLQEALNFEGYPYTEASALRGDGVMETFRLVSKITAKHLYARLQGKPVPLEKAKPAPKAAPAPAPQPVPEPIAPPLEDPIPFPASEVDSSYDAMEEVSLDQLVADGRERPATMTGTVRVPLDDIEELAPEALVGSDAVAVLDEPAPAAVALESDAAPQPMRAEDRAEIESILHQLEGLTARLRALLEA